MGKGEVSMAPGGAGYPLPDAAADQKEVKMLDEITAAQKKMGREIVAVQGLGFVGAVMAPLWPTRPTGKENPSILSTGNSALPLVLFGKFR